MRIIAQFAIGLAVLLVTFQPAAAQETPEVVERLRQKYQTIDALRAHFTRTTTSPYAQNANRFTGEVVLSGDKYRVETQSQTLVTDGETTWVYTPSDNQVLINEYRKDETTFSLHDFLFNFSERYTVTETEIVQLDGEEHHRVELQAKEESDFFKALTVWIRSRDNLVTRLVVHDVNDTRTTYELTDITLNPDLSSQPFTFSPPESAEIVDLRSS